MSEPLSTSDIEDVVSSVRRLVSPEARPRPLSRDLGQDKLLLTPALRVVSDTPLILTVPVAEAPIADTIPDAPPADAGGQTHTRAEGDIPLLVVDGEWEDAFWSEPEASLAELALGTEEAELVTATEPPAEAVLDGMTDPQPDLAALADEIAAPAALPDPAVDETLSAPMPEAGPDPEDGLASSELAETMIDQDGNPVTVLDEEALNQIVRHLIREELQGVLGERITHNVRKLVRAEINRALTARSLD